jgi:hypothetical protein
MLQVVMFQARNATAIAKTAIKAQAKYVLILRGAVESRATALIPEL